MILITVALVSPASQLDCDPGILHPAVSYHRENRWTGAFDSYDPGSIGLILDADGKGDLNSFTNKTFDL